MLTQLKQLGLSGNEAKVYLASLELGEATVQEIARKAGVNRPTTYVQIESLIKMGLMSSVEKKKKRFFFAASPNLLSRLLDKKKIEIETKTRDFGKILPELISIFNIGSSKGKPRVMFFEGKEGLKTIQDDILRSQFKSIEEFIPLDDTYKVFPPAPRDHRHRMAEKLNKIPEKVIYTSQKGPILAPKEKFIERRFIPPEKFSFHTEMVIYGDKIALASHKNKLIGIIIDSKEIAESLKSIFNLAWEATDKYQK
ncbi:MAG: helix-turn-helix domain-containing protein [Candidatus Tagabacteria bacterium]